MSQTRGTCGNPKECPTANSRRIFDVPAGTAFIRPECGGKLRPSAARLRTPQPTPFIVFLALQAAFLGCIAWTGISHSRFQKAFASSADAGVPALRLAGSNTIGSGLGPTIAQEFLKHHGASHLQLRNGVNDDEHRVSRKLPGRTSRTFVATSAQGPATAFSGLADNSHDVGMAYDLVGQTTAEEIWPPEVSEVLGVAPADPGPVPAWVVDPPVQMPAAPPRISSGVTGGRIVHQVSPVYPAQARTQGIQGAVVLEIMIGEDGAVPQVTVLSGPSSLANAAQRAVAQWRYIPFELNGKPVPMRKQITIHFKLS